MDSGVGRLTITREVHGYSQNVGKVSLAFLDSRTSSVSRVTTKSRFAVQKGPKQHPPGFPSCPPPVVPSQAASMTMVSQVQPTGYAQAV